MDKKFKSIIYNSKNKVVLSEDIFYGKSTSHITPLVESMVKDIQKMNPSISIKYTITEVK